MSVHVCLNLYVWKSTSPLRLCWTWGLSKFTSPQQKGLGIGRMPQNASIIDRCCVCPCAWTCMCESLHNPSAFVGHEDCLNSPLHNKRVWGSEECLKMLASLMDDVCACVLELICVKICITPPLMLDMRIVWTHLSTTKGLGDRQNASKR